jgi:hypothetical protein
MNLDFEDASISVTSSEILSKISEYDIFKYYCHNFVEIDKSFCSELRDDKSPSCRITDKYGGLLYKDFGNGESFNCWNYVMNKYNCNYYECLNIISNDFKIKSIVVDINPRVLILNDNLRMPTIATPKNKSKIEIVRQNWTSVDYEFWNQYLISFEMLDFYNVVSAKNVILYKNDKRWIFDYTKNSPKYGYIFKDSTKVYAPNENGVGKWMYDGDSDNVEGLDQLKMFGELVIITKSLKDVIDYRMIGIDAIALPSETSKLKKPLVDDLLLRFDRIIVNLDNDKQGIESTNKIVSEYGFGHFFIDDGTKDFSDWIKKNKSLTKAKKMINDKIKSIF